MAMGLCRDRPGVARRADRHGDVARRGNCAFAGVLGFTNASLLTLALALPSLLSAPDDVHRTSAGMFTISYSCAMLLSIVGGWLWDLTNMPVASFAPVALCAIIIVVIASTVKVARQ